MKYVILLLSLLFTSCSESRVGECWIGKEGVPIRVIEQGKLDVLVRPMQQSLEPIVQDINIEHLLKNYLQHDCLLLEKAIKNQAERK